MWYVNGNSVSGTWLNIEPVRVLYDFDGPRIFICKSVTQELFLAFQCGEENRIMRFLIVPFSEDLERRLTAGEINLRDALTRPLAWVFDVNYGWEVVGVWKVEIDDLPANVIPKAGIMLWPHLQQRIRSTILRDCGTTTVLPTIYFGQVTGPYYVAMGAA